MKRNYFIAILAVFALFIACKNPGGGGSDSSDETSFTVTFDKNGGTSEASPQTKTVVSPATTVDSLPTAPTRTDYAFTGWNTAADGSGSEFTAETVVTEDITVYAQWLSDNALAIKFSMTGNITGDSVTALPANAEHGAAVTINYALAGGSHNNRLTFSGIKAHIAQVDADTNGTTGSRTYTVDKGDAIDRVITIVAAFTHTNKKIDTIAFESESVQKTYGDDGNTFTLTVSNSGQGSGAITYSSDNPDIATVNATTGQVTIVAAGGCTITATKAADDIWEKTTDTYTLHIEKLKLTISGTVVTKTKGYDSNTTATVTTVGTLGNVVGNEDVTVSATAVYNSPNVADANKITVTYSISGAQAGNYDAPDGIEISDGVSISKATGATLTDTITTTTLRYNRIVINAVTKPTNQTVEYAISTTNSAPASGWQDSTAFIGLTASTTYHVFARAKETANYAAGTTISNPFTTLVYTEPPVSPSIVDFEDKAINDTYNRVSGQGSSSAAVVADPDTTSYPNEKSLQITSTNWNNGAIIPINLPFALKNYESFTFRYRLATSMQDNNNRGNGIFVYVMSTTSGLPSGQLGNSNNAYTSKLLKNIVPDYGVTNQWVDYEIELDGENLQSDIKELQGDVFLVIGINSAQSITYQLDDLTFNIIYNFVPPPSLNPASATFSKGAPANITVDINLYGTNTLQSITGGNPAITSSGYSVSGSTVTITSTYLLTQADGPLTLTFTSSNTKTTPFVITIRSASLLTEYNFATDTPSTITTVGTGISATITNGLLTVTRTAGYGSPTGVVIPFDFATTNIGSYSRVEVRLKGSGDLTYKTMLVEYTTGTAASPGDNTTFGSISTGSLGSSFVTLQAPRSGSPSATGPVYVIISFGSTNPSVHEIESIKFAQ